MTDYLDDAARDAVAAVDAMVREDDTGVTVALNNCDLPLVATILTTWQASIIKSIAHESGAPVLDVLDSWRRNVTQAEPEDT